MVVISNGKSTRENGSLDRTLNELHQAGVETVLFDKVGANPLKSVVEEGGRFAKDSGCDYEKCSADQPLSPESCFPGPL